MYIRAALHKDHTASLPCFSKSFYATLTWRTEYGTVGINTVVPKNPSGNPGMAGKKETGGRRRGESRPADATTNVIGVEQPRITLQPPPEQ